MKSSAKAGSPCLRPDFKRKAFNVSLFHLVMGLVGTLEEVKEIPLCSQFAQKWAALVFVNHEWLVNLTRSFLAPIEMIMFFSFKSYDIYFLLNNAYIPVILLGTEVIIC